MRSKRRFSIGAVLLMAFLLPTPGSAFPGNAGQLQNLIENTTPEARAKFQTMEMKKSLKLDGEQIKKVHNINLEHARKIQKIVESKEGRFMELRELMEARDHQDSELKDVLSQKQFSDYGAVKEKMRENMMNLKHQ